MLGSPHWIKLGRIPLVNRDHVTRRSSASVALFSPGNPEPLFVFVLFFPAIQHVCLLLGHNRGMGAFQLPDSVEGAAIGCLLYSVLCLAANVILVWLIWVHRERASCESLRS